MADIRSTYTDMLGFYGQHSPRQLAQTFGTPLYVYNEGILRKRCRELKTLSDLPSFGVSYSVKANSNPALLSIIREEGLLADAMSPGELYMDALAGYEREEIFYISNNNSMQEMENALDKCALVSVDSLAQLEILGQLRPGSRVMTRLNPGIGAGHSSKVITAGHDTKFGIGPASLGEILAICEKYELVLSGLNQHIGSLFMQPDAYVDAAAVLLDIAASLPSKFFDHLQILDFGGGFGIPYHKYEGETRLDIEGLGQRLDSMLRKWSESTGYRGRFLVEPGRYVVAECGVLVGTVLAVKNNEAIRYVGTDLGFNVLMRPVLYNSFHDVEIYRSHAPGQAEAVLRQTLVGNICESGDILAQDRELPPIVEGDIVGILDAGAYGYSMASNYNERLLPAEVLIDLAGNARLIRRRQNLADLAACLVGQEGKKF